MELEHIRPNAKVRCIDADFTLEATVSFRPNKVNLPKLGHVYTIRDKISDVNGIGGILLNQVCNKHLLKEGRGEPGFKLHRFELVLDEPDPSY